MNLFLHLLGVHLLPLIAYPFIANNTIFRLGLLVVVVLCCINSLKSIDKQAWWGIGLAQYTCGFMLNTNYFLFLRKGANSYSQGQKSRLDSFTDVQTALFNCRGDIAVKDLPSFRKREPAYGPPRKDFLIQRGWTFAWRASALVFAHSHPLVVWHDDFASPKDRLLRRIFVVSLREWVILIHTAFQIWFKPYCLLNSAHSFASVVAIALGDSPAHWRPLFEDIREAYTLQRFFG